MSNNVLLSFLAIDFVFAGTGGMLIAAAIISMNGKNGTPINSDVASTLLLSQIPAIGALINAVFIFLTFAISLLGAFNSKDRLILRIHSWIVIFCAAFTLILGLDIWISTLKTRSNLSNLWNTQTAAEQSLLQQRFNCCGYWNSTSPPYVNDNVCPNDAAAALLGGCVSGFSSFANGFLDLVFTGGFGIVAVDAILFLSTIVVLKDRAEKERYRLIDEKGGYEGI